MSEELIASPATPPATSGTPLTSAHFHDQMHYVRILSSMGSKGSAYDKFGGGNFFSNLTNDSFIMQTSQIGKMPEQ